MIEAALKIVPSAFPFSGTLGHLLVRHFIDNPIFLVGCGRSGTSVLVQALNQHPGILAGRHEAPLYQYIGEIAFVYSEGPVADYFQDTTRIPANDLRCRLRRLCFESLWGNSFGLRAHLANLKQDPKAFLNTQYWLGKAFPLEEQARGLQWLFPRAKFIHIYRNGIEVVASMSRFGWFKTQDFETRCRFWADRVGYYAYLRRRHNALTIRHEDFLLQPAQELETVQRFLRLSVDSGPTDYASSTIVHPRGQPTRKGNPKQEILSRTPSWHSWSAQQREMFRTICADAMRELAYEVPF